MKKNMFVFTPGKLSRKDNTIFYMPFTFPNEADDEQLQEEILLSIDSEQPETSRGNKKVLPIADIDSFYIMTEASYNTKFLEFCSQNNINIHYFNRFGFYYGSFIGKSKLQSGYALVHQVEHYKNNKKRLVLAKSFVRGAAFNISKNLKYYNNRDKDMTAQLDTIESILYEIDEAQDIEHVMNVEGRIRKIYYTAYNEILTNGFKFEKRKYNPPTDPINAIISYCNSLVYTTCLSELYHTQLEPTVSFLHQPSERRYSLALDLAEIFKPLIADRMMFKLINQGQLKLTDFEKDLNYCYLKESGRKKIAQEYDKRLQKTIKHRELKRNVSYRRLIRLECYKLLKHVTGEKEYVPFKAWW